MPRKSKKFIDKKKSVTFTLVHRSQKDPEAANEDAPQRVLVSSKEEQMKFGINYDDDYDYLQHLRDVTEHCNVEQDCFRIGKSSSQALMEADSEKKTQLILPSEVFASLSQNKVGLLNLAAPISGPQPDLDDDIMAALDGEICSDEEELEDDFCIRAGKESLELDPCEDYDEDGDDDDYEEEDGDDADDEDGYMREEVGYGNEVHDKVKEFLNSHISCEVPKDSNQLISEGCFKEFCEKLRMDDDDDDDSDNGYTCDNKFSSVIKQYMDSANKKEEFKVPNGSAQKYLGCMSDDDKEELVEITVEVPDDQWDCESILTTLSTTSNLPKTIDFPKKNPKSTKPSQKGNNKSSKSEFDGKRPTLVLLRDSAKTKEENKLRKEAIKHDRKVRRIHKVETKEFFKEEKALRKQQMIQKNANFQGSSVLSQF